MLTGTDILAMTLKFYKEKKAVMWLIQGRYFQNNSWLDLEMMYNGSGVVIKSGVVSTMFSGILHPEPEQCDGPRQGIIVDVSGESALYDVSVTDTEILFVKIYLHRKDLIHYSLNRKIGNIWVGTYKGKEVGDGTAWASIVPIEPQFFDPREFARLIGKETLHEWGNEQENVRN